jgi:AraC-like DNA-binding protein
MDVADHGYIRRELAFREKPQCPIGEGLADVLCRTPDSNESRFIVPPEMGRGRTSRMQVGRSIEMCIYDMQLFHDVRLSGKTQGDAYILSFCMGEDMAWQETISGQAMELGKGTGMLCHAGEINEAGIYEMNRHYQAVKLSFHPMRFHEYFTDSSWEKRIFSNRFANYKYTSYMLPPEVHVLIAESLHCPYIGTMRTVYLEGKALELLATCVNTVTARGCGQKDCPPLSRTDVESIIRAKEILDESISLPVTITSIARRVCLNETKLKSGFKHIYGKPVYSYLLDKRLSVARVMLETRDITVSQAADFAGYGNGSSFSKAFYKKYGFYPSECAQAAKGKKT